MKKGINISFEALIAIFLAIFALVVFITFFTGQWRKGENATRTLENRSEYELEQAKIRCEWLCTLCRVEGVDSSPCKNYTQAGYKKGVGFVYNNPDIKCSELLGKDVVECY